MLGEALMYTAFIILLVVVGVLVAIGVVSLIKAFGVIAGVIAGVVLLFLFVLFSLWTQYN